MNWEVWTMKSKTLSCEMTILRKDLTRYAPMWISLSVVLFLFAFDQLSANYPDPLEYLPLAMFFAPIFAVNLFGYLTDPAECSAMHSLPVRREGLFLIHTAAAFLMYLVPMSVYFIATAPVMEIGFLPRLGWSALDFAYSFSISMICVLITGRKIGAALLYLFLQLLPALVAMYMEFLILPLLPGLYLTYEFLQLGVTSASVSEFISEVFYDQVQGPICLSAVAILAVSLVLYGICLWMYRRRKLEHAGDLLAVRWLDPVFAVCSGLTGGCVIDLFFGLGGSSFDPLLFGLGMAFGYFSYWMLSKKSARVFQPRLLAGFAALAVTVAGSVFLISMDPLDRVHYQPDPSVVQTATLSEGAYSVREYTTDDPEEIARLQALQLELLEHYEELDDDMRSHGDVIHITYTLDNGRTIQRQYKILSYDLLDRASWYLSQSVTFFETDAPEFRYVHAHRNGSSVSFPSEKTGEFQEILLEDCRQGRMFSFDRSYPDPRWSVEIWYSDSDFVYITIPSSAVDTIAWLTENCEEKT